MIQWVWKWRYPKTQVQPPIILHPSIWWSLKMVNPSNFRYKNHYCSLYLILYPIKYPHSLLESPFIDNSLFPSTTLSHQKPRKGSLYHQSLVMFQPHNSLFTIYWSSKMLGHQTVIRMSLNSPHNMLTGWWLKKTLWNISKSLGMIRNPIYIYIWKSKKCSKPPCHKFFEGSSKTQIMIFF